MISENQGFKKSRSVSNLSGPANLDLFQGLHLSRKIGKKKSRFAGPEIFLKLEADLEFQKSTCRLKDWICKNPPFFLGLQSEKKV